MKLLFVSSLLLPTACAAFSSALFHEAPALQKLAPSKYDGIDIELPDFDELFYRIQQVSPLAKKVMLGGEGMRTATMIQY